MFRPPLALASLSGQSDAEWARAGSEFAGCAFLGGIAIDERSRTAARKLVDRDRDEFLPEDPFAFVDQQLETLESTQIQPAVNVRSATREPIARAARVCRDRDAFLEINAHCRQDEMCAVGCGERLLADTERLRSYVETAADTEATVGVKVRTEVPDVDLLALASELEGAGAAFIHVDAMDSERVIADVVDETDCFVIANNGVRDGKTVREYVEYGADAVSVGRPSDNPVVLERVKKAVDAHLGLEPDSIER